MLNPLRLWSGMTKAILTILSEENGEKLTFLYGCVSVCALRVVLLFEIGDGSHFYIYSCRHERAKIVYK